jgi:hypothetical protein
VGLNKESWRIREADDRYHPGIAPRHIIITIVKGQVGRSCSACRTGSYVVHPGGNEQRQEKPPFHMVDCDHRASHRSVQRGEMDGMIWGMGNGQLRESRGFLVFWYSGVLGFQQGTQPRPPNPSPAMGMYGELGSNHHGTARTRVLLLPAAVVEIVTRLGMGGDGVTGATGE